MVRRRKIHLRVQNVFQFPVVMKFRPIVLRDRLDPVTFRPQQFDRPVERLFLRGTLVWDFQTPKTVNQTGIKMNEKVNLVVVVYVGVMIAAIVSIDLLFFKHLFWERLMVNIGISLVFAAFYSRYLKKQ